jgi:hypothetical protein
MDVVDLARDQPAVVPPFGQPFPCCAAYTRQGIGQAIYVVGLH